MKKYILILLLLPFIQSGNGTKYTDTEFTILEYGLPRDFERQKAINTIAKKWGIRFYDVAGCIVSQELKNSAKTNNDKVYKLIEKKYGINWKKKFEEEIDAEFEKLIEKKDGTNWRERNLKKKLTQNLRNRNL